MINNNYVNYSNLKLPNFFARILIAGISAMGFLGSLMFVPLAQSKLPMSVSIFLLMSALPVILSVLGLRFLESRVDNAFEPSIKSYLTLLIIASISFLIFSVINHSFFDYGYGGSIKTSGFLGSLVMAIEGLLGIVYFFGYPIMLFRTLFGKLS